ncbi:MAG: hypothetical protein ACKO0V_11235, partial [bacterium]
MNTACHSFYLASIFSAITLSAGFAAGKPDDLAGVRDVVVKPAGVKLVGPDSVQQVAVDYQTVVNPQ